MNTTPKYSKVELLIKNSKSADRDITQTIRLEFNDAGMIITGDYIIVIEDERNAEHSLTSTGKIFQLSEVVAYKTYQS